MSQCCLETEAGLAGCSTSEHVRQSDIAAEVVGVEVMDARATEDEVWIKYYGVYEASLDLQRREVLHATAVPVIDADLVAPLAFVAPEDWTAGADEAGGEAKSQDSGSDAPG